MKQSFIRATGFLLFILGTVFNAGLALAEVVEFPTEELATESVLPIFDYPVSVRDRLVETAGRFEIGGFGGFNLNEPFYSPYNIGGYVTYHWDEEQAINVFGNYYLGGTSSYADQLKRGEGLSNPANGLDFERAPQVKYFLLGNYQYTLYYGKISLSKQTVTNLSLFVLGGLGLVGVGDEMSWAGNVGLGKKFYFTPNFAFRFDLRLLFYQGPNPLSADIRVNRGGELPNSSFDSTINLNYLLTLGLVYLIPSS